MVPFDDTNQWIPSLRYMAPWNPSCLIEEGVEQTMQAGLALYLPLVYQ